MDLAPLVSYAHTVRLSAYPFQKKKKCPQDLILEHATVCILPRKSVHPTLVMSSAMVMKSTALAKIHAAL